MSWSTCYRFRFSSSAVVCLALFYIVVFNGLSLYGLIKSTYTPVSLPVNRDRLYFAYMKYDRALWKCKKPHLSQTPLPLTALASFPGSGNTWVRHILQQATGILTGSIYNDKVLKIMGFPGENIQNSSVLVVKTHDYGRNETQKYQRAILILRNPKDALLAEFNRLRGGHIGFARKEDFTKKWKGFVTIKAKSWFELNKSWLDFPGDLHIVRYEDLKSDPINEIKSLLKFLRINISQKELSCVIENLTGRFKRPERDVTIYTLYPSLLGQDLERYELRINRTIKQRHRQANIPHS